MGTPENSVGASGSPPENKQVPLLIEIARSQVDEAYKVSERLDGKARTLLQAATVFFATSQAAIGIQLAARSGRDPAPWWVATVAALLGVIGLIGVGFTARRAMRLQEPADQKAVDVERLRTDLFHFAEDNDPRVPRFLFEMLTKVVIDRRTKNAEKVKGLAKVQFWATVALASSGTALLVGIAATYFR